MATKWNPMETNQTPEPKPPEGSVQDPLAPFEDQQPELEAVQETIQQQPSAPKPKALTPEELQQDPDELLSEENEDGTEQQSGGRGEQD